MTQGGMTLGTGACGPVSVRLNGTEVPLTADRRFLVAFGRDHGPTAAIEMRSADGAVLRETLQIAPRKWDIQSLPTLPREPRPPGFLARRKIELARINAARARRRRATAGDRRSAGRSPAGSRAGSARSASMPVSQGPSITASMSRRAPARDRRARRWCRGAGGGRALHAEGNLLILDHGMGLTSAFLHLSRIDVKRDQRVTRGQMLGTVGSTGRATGPHLHWAMKWRNERIDPELVAGAMPGAAR
jgi:murein DD-endopeptidase MepM/ murein hydrolase activator NlpD